MEEEKQNQQTIQEQNEVDLVDSDIGDANVKPDKFDRQVRLWGARGQRIIGTSHILLLGCEPAGVEAAKNLVLPGIGELTVIDDRNTETQDLGRNFFVTVNDLGKPIAQAVVENLIEMNPEDVKANFIVRKVSEAARDEQFLLNNKIKLVIANEMRDADIVPLSSICFKNNINLVIVNSYGFIGRIRAQGKQIHTVIEPKQDKQALYDLRITQPFETLQKFVDSFDLNNLQRFGKIGDKNREDMSYDWSMAHQELGHVPFLVLIMKAFEIYRNINVYPNQFGILEKRNNIPKTKTEREAIEKILKDGKEHLMETNQENYNEALNNLTWIYKFEHPILDFNLQNVFSHDLCKNADKNSEQFWILARAAQIFTERNGVIPYNGNDIPDMQCRTADYQRLQKVYRAKFLVDRKQMKEIVEEIIGSKITGGADDLISRKDIKLFMKNILQIDFKEFNSYEQEINKPSFGDDSILEVQWTDCPVWYAGMRATSEFLTENNRYPSTNNENDAQIINQKILNLFSTKMTKIKVKKWDTLIYAKEFCRYENSKLHNIGSALGGFVAQESVKLLMSTFFPLNNTLIFNGTDGTAQSFRI